MNVTSDFKIAVMHEQAIDLLRTQPFTQEMLDAYPWARFMTHADLGVSGYVMH